MFGIGYGVRTIRLLSSRKSEMNLTLPSFLGIMKVGAAHSERFTRLSTPTLQRRSTSRLSVSMCTRGTGKAFAWYGLTPGLSSIR